MRIDREDFLSEENVRASKEERVAMSSCANFILEMIEKHCDV